MERTLKEGKTYLGEFFEKNDYLAQRFFYNWRVEGGVLKDEQNRNSKCTQNTCFVLFF